MIEDIIKENGLSDHLVQFTAPSGLSFSGGFNQSRHEQRYSTLNIENPKELFEVYEGDFDTNLIYLKTPDEDIDFENLKKVIESVSDIVSNDIMEDKDHIIFMTTYEVPSKAKEIMIKTFSRDIYTESMFREEYSLAEIAEKSDIKRADTVGFDLLDIYGVKLEYRYTGSGRDMSNWDIEKFIQMIK